MAGDRESFNKFCDLEYINKIKADLLCIDNIRAKLLDSSSHNNFPLYGIDEHGLSNRIPVKEDTV